MAALALGEVSGDSDLVAGLGLGSCVDVEAEPGDSANAAVSAARCGTGRRVLPAEWGRCGRVA
nr:hypothetical protein [Micromonospora sp. DSM 115978]